ncbi:MAG: PorP/SprF family type IX secretion system membrane protein [Cytophagaceae bacterium]
MCVLVYCMSVAYSYGQQYSDYADRFNLFFKNYAIYNPASIGTVSNLEANVSYKSLTGLFSQVNTYYTNVNFRANRGEREGGEHKHNFGLTLFGDKEGEFFRRSRAYLNYSFHLEVGENLFIAAGTSLGLVNYTYRSSTAGMGGSDLAFIGNVGLWVYNDRVRAGVSVNDFPNNSVRPIDEETVLFRHYVFTGDYRLDIDHNLSLRPVLSATFSDVQYTSVSPGLVCVLQERLSGGLLYRSRNGFVFLAGLEEIEVLSGMLDLTFSYMVPIQRYTNISVNTFELAVSYYLAPKK